MESANFWIRLCYLQVSEQTSVSLAYCRHTLKKYIRALVVISREVWYMDDGMLTKQFCPTNVQSFDEQPEILEECEVCEEAKYQLIFQGLWSKFTHPRHFPDKWISYFSDLIGASHSNNYRYYPNSMMQ